MSRIEGATIWITGASSGIGEELAVVSAARGARLILSARTEDALARVRQRCERSDEHTVLPLDLTDSDSIDRALAKVEGLGGGPPDILINNAGVTQRSHAVETELDVYRRLMEINFFGAVALTRGVLPGMLSRGTGHIVAISSVAGKFGPPLRTGYAAAKHALQGYMESLHAEIYDQGIRTTVACPGFIRTEISRHALVGDGGTYDKMDPGQASGMPATKCASIILDAVQQDRPEVWIGREKFAVWLHNWLPGLFRRILRRGRPLPVIGDRTRVGKVPPRPTPVDERHIRIGTPLARPSRRGAPLPRRRPV